MNFKEKKKRRNLYFSIIGVMLVIFILKSQLNTVRAGVNKVVLPVKIFVYNTTKDAKNAVTNLKDIDKIIKKNQELERANYNLKINHSYISELQLENKRLKTILDIKNSSVKEILIANIAFKDPLSVYDEFIINKGTKDGIKKNMSVLNKENLLGRVIEVYNDTALVELVSKSENYTSVVVGRDKHLGILKGKSSNKLSIENIETDTAINVGDRVYTSGISDIYPKDFYIGQVTKVETKKEDLFKRIELTLSFNVFELNEVIIQK